MACPFNSDGGVEGEESPQVQRFPLHDSAKLPLAIKEKDVEYQFHRLVLFSRLLESYPYSRPRIISEALLDVCPLLRGEIWAALLGVKVATSVVVRYLLLYSLSLFLPPLSVLPYRVIFVQSTWTLIKTRSQPLIVKLTWTSLAAISTTLFSPPQKVIGSSNVFSNHGSFLTPTSSTGKVKWAEID